MAVPLDPVRPRPRVEIDTPVSLPEPKIEDLGEAVPVGEPEDEGFVIEEEDREYGPPGAGKLKK